MEQNRSRQIQSNLTQVSQKETKKGSKQHLIKNFLRTDNRDYIRRKNVKIPLYYDETMLIICGWYIYGMVAIYPKTQTFVIL